MRRITQMAGYGLLFGGIFSVWALILSLFQGFEIHLRGGVTVAVTHVIGVYLLGGLAAGIIVGVFFPLVRWVWGAALVGVIAALPFSVGVMASLNGFSEWTTTHTLAVAIMAPIFGIFVGIGYRNIFYEPADEDDG